MAEKLLCGRAFLVKVTGFGIESMKIIDKPVSGCNNTPQR